MADEFITKLKAISQPGTTAVQFLRKLGPIHAQWHHDNNLGTLSLGFLLFHWELIQRLEAVGGPAHFGGITPFTTQQLASFNAPYNVHDVVHQGDVASLEEFSIDTEDWHNNAHMAIGMQFHVNLMNPKTNIKLVQFWQLHYFINSLFESRLSDYRTSATDTIPAVIGQLEASSAVARI